MDESLIIRRYLPADEDATVDVWARAARQAHPFVAGEGEGDRERKLREVYLVDAENWVVESTTDGSIVGLLGMLGSEIGGLFVAPEAQGRGVGRALICHAAARHSVVTLEVYTDNGRAREFYDRMGFTEVERKLDADTGHELIALRRVSVAP
ncbi:acetyltransferase [Mycolicibacterium peregrinum]|uniref:Acetyltransferase n=1 Tax=Mycolicibacterium peregrinum TaxID=43304 RepID=A0A1A0QZS9_MYCPR|nr:GNAT family N-acetyltransferase [Mycolicibacterium peregrinum]OBB27044.1 acetyltransferase [Mycolicibacterium peregrinum]